MTIFKRIGENPIISPKDVPPSRPDLEVVGVFNPGACRFGDEILLLLRVAEAAVQEPGYVRVPVVETADGTARIAVKSWRRSELGACDLSDTRHFVLDGRRYLSSLSHFRVARSVDGIHFAIDKKPFMIPETPMESYGIEDPRIAAIEGKYFITCTAAFEDGFGVLLAETSDFRTVTRHGFIFPPENKNTALFPEKVGGRYLALHRPIVKDFGKPCIWTAESPDVRHFGNSRCLMRPNGIYQNKKIGAGPGPIRTDEGWVLLYHGVDDHETYRLFLALLDLEDPSRIIANITTPVLEPTLPFEKEGFVPNVVFSNGWVRTDDDRYRVYYGGADTAIGVAEADGKVLLDALKQARV